MHLPLRFVFPVVATSALLLGAAGHMVRLPVATPINVHVKADVSSGSAHVGDSVELVVNDDVVINGYVLIAKGADGAAVVDAVVPATSDTPGQLHLTFKWVRSVDNSKIGVVGEQGNAGSGDGKGVDANAVASGGQAVAGAIGANAAGGMLAQAGGLFGHFLKKKKAEATLSVAQIVPLEVKNLAGVPILSNQKSTAPATSSDDIK